MIMLTKISRYKVLQICVVHDTDREIIGFVVLGVGRGDIPSYNWSHAFILMVFHLSTLVRDHVRPAVGHLQENG